jgi:hypothetical protein
MKTTKDNFFISKSLEEVWEWKEKAYEETKDKTFEELKAIYKKSVEDAAECIGAKLVKLPNGNYKFE